MERLPEEADDQAMRLQSAVVSLQSSATDSQILLRLLTEQLSSALGQRLSVERKGGLFKKSNEVKRLRADIGDRSFIADASAPTIACSIGHISGGITIKTESTGISDWLVKLLGCLQDEAKNSEAARQALDSIILGGS